jgi:hypothetical protein
MKLIKTCMASMLMLALSTGGASAQDKDKSSAYHPFLSDTIHISLGAWRPKKNISLFLSDGTEFNQEIDRTETETTPAIAARWRFTENWSLFGQFWDVDSEASAVLDKDVEFDNGTILAGSGIGVKIETSVLRVFFGRSFFKKPQSEWGAGAGLHWMESTISLKLKVDSIPANPDWNVNESRSVKAGVPLPNIGAWYMYSWSPKWVTRVRLDWLDITVDEYSGAMFNGSAGVNYQISKQFGVGLALNGFKLEAEQKKAGQNIKLETRQWGPFLSLTANW